MSKGRKKIPKVFLDKEIKLTEKNRKKLKKMLEDSAKKYQFVIVRPKNRKFKTRLFLRRKPRRRRG